MAENHTGVTHMHEYPLPRGWRGPADPGEIITTQDGNHHESFEGYEDDLIGHMECNRNVRSL